MVAPYEADAQLAFLSRMDIVDLVISEDSDTIVYGCKSVLFKLDKEGNGDLIKRSDLGTNEALSFAHWADDLFNLPGVTTCQEYAMWASREHTRSLPNVIH